MDCWSLIRIYIVSDDSVRRFSSDNICYIFPEFEPATPRELYTYIVYCVYRSLYVLLQTRIGGHSVECASDLWRVFGYWTRCGGLVGLGLPELAEVCRPAWRVGVATHVAGSSTCAPRVPRPTASQTHPSIFPSEGDPRAGRVDDERDPWGGIWWGGRGGQSFISVEESRTLRPALWGKLKFPLGKNIWSVIASCMTIKET